MSGTFDDGNAILTELAGLGQADERKLIGPPRAHLDAPCTDECYEPREPILVEPAPADAPCEERDEVWAAIHSLAERIDGLAAALADASHHLIEAGLSRRITALAEAVRAAENMPWIKRDAGGPPFPVALEEKRAWIVGTAAQFDRFLADG